MSGRYFGGEEAPLSRDAFEGVNTSVAEPQAGSGHQVANRLGCEHLARAGRCVQCGACIAQCPFDALFFRTPQGGVIEPETVRRLELNLIGTRKVQLAGAQRKSTPRGEARSAPRRQIPSPGHQGIDALIGVAALAARYR